MNSFLRSRVGVLGRLSAAAGAAIIAASALGAAEEPPRPAAPAAGSATTPDKSDRLLEIIDQLQKDPALLARARAALDERIKAAGAAAAPATSSAPTTTSAPAAASPSPAPAGAAPAAGSVEALTAKIEALAKRVEDLQARVAAAGAAGADAPAAKAELDQALEKSKRARERLAKLDAAAPVKPEASAKPAPGGESPTPATLVLAPGVAPAAAVSSAAASGRALQFNRDIRPILSENCYACHGPDKAARKADLRLDIEAEAFKALGEGRHAFVAGDLDHSEAVRRVTATDPDDLMPPAKSGKKLKPEQIAALVEWVRQGAKWQKHWAFLAPEKVEPPAPDAKAPNAEIHNPVDAFILARLAREGLAAGPQADRRSLIRRATLDLTGLPPTPEEVHAYLGDDAPDAYGKVVDRLLASPRYGENMARGWLDAARYADTHGYHIDSERSMWRWRDWTINAFNSNKPYDQFITEQIAGDLLPDATLDQRIATGFSRNHMINYEGGAIPKEYLNNYVVDRVNTFGSVFMGMSVACAQCHDHKYDPMTQKEYYQLYAFFNTVPEEGLDGQKGNAAPKMKAPLPEQSAELDEIAKKTEGLDREMRKPLPGLDGEQPNWEREWGGRLLGRWRALEPLEMSSSKGQKLEKLADLSIQAKGDVPDTDTYEIIADASGEITALRLEVLAQEGGDTPKLGRTDNGNFILSEFEADVAPVTRPDEGKPVKFAMAIADFSQSKFEIAKAIDGDGKTGWAIDGKPEPRVAWFVPVEPIRMAENSIIKVRLRHLSESIAKHVIGRFRVSVTSDPTLIPARLDPWFASGPYKADTGDDAYRIEFGPEKEIDLDATDAEGRYKWVERPELTDGPARGLGDTISATYLTRVINSPTAREILTELGSNDAIKVWFNGEVVLDRKVRRALTVGEDKLRLSLKAGENRILMKVVNYGDACQFSFARTEERLGRFPFEIEPLFALEPGKRTEAQLDTLKIEFRRERWSEWPRLDRELVALNTRKDKVAAAIPDTMVMAEMDKPRETFVLTRGAYDAPGEKVEAAPPAFLPPLPEGAPANRLGLAQWLTDPKNPLTARVTVNRLWRHFFGVGLVKTVEDFGAQGEWPSDPELLDWLAVQFIESGWDLKALARLMVESEAYMRDSRVNPDLLAHDPENRLLARGPRHRLDAEVIRDGALAIGGLLVERVGGPSVRPYQPEGLWEEVAYGGDFTAQRFVQDHGDRLYRRSMYTFWKRQSAPPIMTTFDAPSREVCVVNRSRTNTPLQALALMNGVQFVEAARALAQRLIRESGPEAPDRVARAFELATARRPTEAETAVLVDLVAKQTDEYRARPEDAKKLLGVGEAKPDDKIDPAELAAWTMLSSIILNLDETITKG